MAEKITFVGVCMRPKLTLSLFKKGIMRLLDLKPDIALETLLVSEEKIFSKHVWKMKIQVEMIERSGSMCLNCILGLQVQDKDYKRLYFGKAGMAKSTLVSRAPITDYIIGGTFFTKEAYC